MHRFSVVLPFPALICFLLISSYSIIPYWPLFLLFLLFLYLYLWCPVYFLSSAAQLTGCLTHNSLVWCHVTIFIIVQNQCLIIPRFFPLIAAPCPQPHSLFASHQAFTSSWTEGRVIKNTRHTVCKEEWGRQVEERRSWSKGRWVSIREKRQCDRGGDCRAEGGGAEEKRNRRGWEVRWRGDLDDKQG